jgi:hypothetical protein
MPPRCHILTPIEFHFSCHPLKSKAQPSVSERSPVEAPVTDDEMRVALAATVRRGFFVQNQKMRVCRRIGTHLA